MDLPTFRRLLDQCGTDLETWPDLSGAAARELMAGCTEACEAYLSAFPDPNDRACGTGDESALVERIMDVVARERR